MNYSFNVNTKKKISPNCCLNHFDTADDEWNISQVLLFGFSCTICLHATPDVEALANPAGTVSRFVRKVGTMYHSLQQHTPVDHLKAW